MKIEITDGAPEYPTFYVLSESQLPEIERPTIDVAIALLKYAHDGLVKQRADRIRRESRWPQGAAS